MDEKEHALYEQDIDDLVFRYQEGDSEAGEEILRVFGCHPDEEMGSYIGKFYNMLRYGRFSFNDRDSRSFLSSFIADPDVREKMIPFYQYKKTKQEAMKVLDKVVNMCRAIPDEDLKQDLRMLLLVQAGRYKKITKNVNFLGYLYNSFRYALKNYIKAQFKNLEPYMHMPQKLCSMQEDVYMDADTEIKIEDLLFTDQPMLESDDKLGNGWVRGITCGDEFFDLTQLQRLILKLHYEDGLSDRKISDKLGLHINTIFRQRQKAIGLVEDAHKRLVEGGYYE